ncbi:hypothetical protein BpHYR1_012456 [Brachionus plicatilis]|uniref:Uncharacterized protein n=1 Tax=Brachionus plicatilis TaxID=10195 RepID=A0A3M7RJH8_BRAPC|nr:hypothetical protein BpHYR1_012456 [Brachionus plicatilis]
MDLSDVEPQTPLTSGYHGSNFNETGKRFRSSNSPLNKCLSDPDLTAHLDVTSLRQKIDDLKSRVEKN